MEELTIHRLLANSCSNPMMDWKEYEKFTTENHRRRNAVPKEEQLPYTGWSKFEIELCCITFIVIAKQIPTEGEWSEATARYEIKEWSTA